MFNFPSLSRRSLSFIAGLGLLAPSITFAQSAPDAMQLLKQADKARGGGLLGLVWQVSTHTTGTNADEALDQVLRLQAVDKPRGTSSVAQVLEPPSSKDSKILQVERNMWITKPGLKKPVAISPRQRLTGQASIGDIAATDYARQYTASYLREETVNQEPCHVLDLRAVDKQSTYDRITYWISIQRGVGVQAEFLSLSGKKLKTATFVYDNVIKDKDRQIPFVSQMTIQDALTDARTVLNYSRIQVKSIPDAVFDIGNLQ